ncbi:carboxymuconolactone decarboxylase [Variovorax sp. WS11]|nr:carboxymuconolactone decarboxylase [Variovorax sp. WS11]
MATPYVARLLALVPQLCLGEVQIAGYALRSPSHATACDSAEPGSAQQRHAQGLEILRRIGGPDFDGPVRRLGRVSEDMARLTVDFPYGDVLSRPGLDLRIRQICNVASLIAHGSVQPQLRFHMEGLLNAGGSVQDLVEIIFIATAVLGFPATIDSIGIVRQLAKDRSIGTLPAPAQRAAHDGRYNQGLRAFTRVMPVEASTYLAPFEAVSPELAKWAIEFGFGDILAREHLEAWLRHMVVAVMLATLGNREDVLSLHLRAAMIAGATRGQIIEALMQISVYAGFPAALNAFGVASTAFELAEQATPAAPAVVAKTSVSESDALRRERGLAALAATSAGSGEAVVRSFDDVAPEIGQMIVDHSYGDVFHREGLDRKTRELTACAALAGCGSKACETPLRVHINAALNVGATREEVVETLLNMVCYFGFPVVQGAMRIAGEEFKKRGLTASASRS